MNNIISQVEKDRIDSLCVKYRITNYSINPDGTIDVDGDVMLNRASLSAIPLRFGKVSGYFDCSQNQLISLKGSPTIVGGYFKCTMNSLISLEFCPTTVVGTFQCYENILTSLKHCPDEVYGLSCNINKLTSLEHCPTTIHSFFNCSENKLTSLMGCPTTLGDALYCSDNLLTTLEHCPTTVIGDLECHNNPLQTLIHFPKTVGGKYISVTENFDGNLGDFADMLIDAFGDIPDPNDHNGEPYISEEWLLTYKYMNDYEVWAPEFNEENMNDLIADIKDGLR